MATPLDPPCWLAPPQCAPEPQPPVHVNDAASSASAHYEEINSQMMISFHGQALTKCAKLAAHAQRVETVRSIAMAAWQCQEDAAHAQVLAEEADMRCRHNNAYHVITDGFAINLDILAVEMASWHGADNAMALFGMKHHKDDADAQGYHDVCAAAVTYAPQKAATCANMLAASRRREDDVHPKVLPSATDKRNFWEATLRAAHLKYVAQLGFTSSNEFFTWVAKRDASWDGAVVEAPNRTLALAERASANDK
jgi:hypothetical protein